MILLKDAQKLVQLENERISMTRRKVIAFDLDDTLIDSAHRTRVVDGKFDLNYWREKSTWEYISQDTLLPLYFDYLNYKRAGYTVIAVTARQMSEDDYRYLDEAGLSFDFILERKDSLELDAVLKDKALQSFFQQQGLVPYLFFDDKDDNLKIAEKYGFRPMKSQFFNLISVVKDQYAIRNIKHDEISVFKPKKEDLAESSINWN